MSHRLAESRPLRELATDLGELDRVLARTGLERVVSGRLQHVAEELHVRLLRKLVALAAIAAVAAGNKVLPTGRTTA